MNINQVSGQMAAQQARLDLKQKAVREFQDKIIFEGIWRSCLGCINFNKQSEQCMMFKAKPPTEILVHGCRDYDQDIPF